MNHKNKCQQEYIVFLIGLKQNQGLTSFFTDFQK